MGYWKDKVLPIFKKIFEKNGTRKTSAEDACRAFDDSKEEVSKELEEKREELKPKILEIYEACPAEIKDLVKERSESGLRKHSSGVNKFLEDLANIGFPGSNKACEASTKYGPALVSGPVIFIFEKVSTFLPREEQESQLPKGGASMEEHRPPPALAEEKIGEEVKEREAEVTAPPLVEPALASAEMLEPAVV